MIFGTANRWRDAFSPQHYARRSQAGNYLRGWLHLGFNQDEAKRQGTTACGPIIAGRRISAQLPLGATDGV